jgi:hypothetical protein
MQYLSERATARNSLRPIFAPRELRTPSRAVRLLIARFGLPPATASAVAELAGLGDGRSR